jgi:hypothetical protein
MPIVRTLRTASKSTPRTHHGLAMPRAASNSWFCIHGLFASMLNAALCRHSARLDCRVVWDHTTLSSDSHPLRFQKRPISLVDQRQKSIRNLVKEASYFLICRWFRFITLRRIFGIYAIETVGRDGRQSRVAAAPICGHHRGPRRRLTDGSKIRTHWKVVIIFFDHPHRTWSWANVREPRRNFAVRNSWDTRAIAVPIPTVKAQAFDDSTVRRSAATASREPRLGASRPGWRLRQSHHRLQKRSRCSLQPGMTPVPITF